MTIQMIIASALFVVVFICITLELFNKTVIALMGASIFLLFHFISQHDAFLEIDWNVIFLLLRIMNIVGIT